MSHQSPSLYTVGIVCTVSWLAAGFMLVRARECFIFRDRRAGVLRLTLGLPLLALAIGATLLLMAAPAPLAMRTASSFPADWDCVSVPKSEPICFKRDPAKGSGHDGSGASVGPAR